jgi:hypothetical protein
MKREGGCFCGAIRYEATGEPRVVTHCHCLHCRRISGAAFVTWAEFPNEQVRWTKGKPGSVESRPGVTRRFCTACGTPMTYHSTESPRTTDVVACSLDDPESVKPQDHVWASRRISWIHLGDALPQYVERRGD